MKVAQIAQIEARCRLIRVEAYLYSLVSGNNADNPLIADGYYGRNYQNALGCIINCIMLIEIEANLEAIKTAEYQPFAYSWRYLQHRG